MGSKIMIGFLGLSTVVVTFLATRLYRDLLISYEQGSSAHEYSWFFHLLLNLAGYSTILLPGFVIYKYIQKTNYFDKLSSSGCLSRSLFAIFGDPGERLPTTDAPKVEDSPRREAAELALCFSGLMTAYLVWGLLQEKIMTQTYTMPDGSTVKFNDSQLLVFINRLLAFCIAVGRLLWTRTPLFPVPLYQFSYCSLSNIVSAWCQYEALKFVSFPMQVLSKSCKVIPVMLMGKAVSGNKYELYEYVTAAMISAGMVLFMLASKDEYAAGTYSLASGVTLLALYMCCDSFTSSWQARLFARTRAAPLHMVGGVNLFSALLTAAALMQQPPATAVNPRWSLLQHPQFAADVIMLSVSSALGQLLIYRTIARFGAVVFTIIMTLRQAVSILLSCLVYGHRLSFAGVLGVCVVFTAIFLRVYCRQRLRRRRPAST
ncbi:adenosine 3'-phospho 5'-phosphosulfate transporter 1 isoform X2 [Leguminivora glycinivorella]|uniref:adenosine 3'-phospho 5'-phosphosulfate transporter 1 isoform X1 n=1 Tax=Leguminivora glycinivorella TaxID=1035111 RepID=UPI00200CA5A2|nr:adenosine 3'-phospho 5'-phosphosulfate transporter 1 isoform X1 [Leguminivora glycinivorella]XP_047993040.1 adenosine 3'-phospho 5'-phosphosulfate transporter 1 isoform X2 [Leguminivora glycinivorella]